VSADLDTLAWVALALGAVCAGFSKTGISGAGLITVGVFASVLPARQSTGSVLLLFLVGDVFALMAYRSHAHWPTLRRLAVPVLVGIVVGVLFLTRIGDGGLRRTIGALLIALVALHLWVRRRTEHGDGLRSLPRPVTVAAGATSGFTSMIANAGGAVMSIYLLGVRLEMLAFLGTTTWLFFLINVTKVPLSLGLGLLTWEGARIALLTAPFVVVGAWLGRELIKRIAQSTFEWLVLASTVLAGLNLLLR
jgi:uncharacterized membrane protein YfcA